VRAVYRNNWHLKSRPASVDRCAGDGAFAFVAAIGGALLIIDSGIRVNQGSASHNSAQRGTSLSGRNAAQVTTGGHTRIAPGMLRRA